MPQHRASRSAVTRQGRSLDAQGRPQHDRPTAGGQHRAQPGPSRGPAARSQVGHARSSSSEASPPRARWAWRPRLVSAPTLVGAGVLVLATAGVTGAVVPAASSAGDHPTRTAAAGSSLAGGLPRVTTAARTAPDLGDADSAGAGAGTSDRRERAVSRDAHREAQVSASSRRLQAATEKAAKRRTAALAGLAASARHQAAVIEATTWQLPVTAGAYHLTSRFGDCSALWSRCHTGLDFAAPDGTPIHAVAAGTIKEVGYEGAYGNRTVMTTKDGVDLWYCHQSSIAVQPGDHVVAGQVIGAVGSTGNTTGPHVHLEVRPRPDDPIDPFAALVAHGVHP